MRAGPDDLGVIHGCDRAGTLATLAGRGLGSAVGRRLGLGAAAGRRVGLSGGSRDGVADRAERGARARASGQHERRSRSGEGRNGWCAWVTSVSCHGDLAGGGNRVTHTLSRLRSAAVAGLRDARSGQVRARSAAVSLSDGTPVRPAARADAGQGVRRAARATTAGCSSPSGTASARSSSATATSVYTQSRDLKPLDRYFPELADPLRAALPERCVARRRGRDRARRRARLRGAAPSDPPGRFAREDARRAVAGELRRLGPARARRRGPPSRAAGRAARAPRGRARQGASHRST